MANRLKARSRQLGLSAAQVGEIAGVNRTFVYDIMRGKSANPKLSKLGRVAQALKVERNWLLHGMGEVQGEETIVEHPDDSFGGGHLVEQEPMNGARIIFSDRGSRTSKAPIHPICAS